MPENIEADKIDDGGSAFPQGRMYYGGDGSISGGMSLRDHFASQAPEPPDWWLRNVLNVSDLNNACGGREYCDAVAAWKYIHADAMIRRRKNKPAIKVTEVSDKFNK